MLTRVLVSKQNISNDSKFYKAHVILLDKYLVVLNFYRPVLVILYQVNT